jgi:hypothetical protein
MASEACSISLLCKKTVLAEKKEPLLKTTYHPTFNVEAIFTKSRDKRTTPCPHCGKQVEYQAFRYEFSLKKTLRWPALITMVGVLFFFLTIYLIGFGEWETETAMLYFGAWSFIALIFGLGVLVFQFLRYLAFYTKNKYKYIFAITEGHVLGPRHLLKDGRVGASWRNLPTHVE